MVYLICIGVSSVSVLCEIAFDAMCVQRANMIAWAGRRRAGGRSRPEATESGTGRSAARVAAARRELGACAGAAAAARVATARPHGGNNSRQPARLAGCWRLLQLGPRRRMAMAANARLDGCWRQQQLVARAAASAAACAACARVARARANAAASGAATASTAPPQRQPCGQRTATAGRRAPLQRALRRSDAEGAAAQPRATVAGAQGQPAQPRATAAGAQGLQAQPQAQPPALPEGSGSRHGACSRQQQAGSRR